MRSIVAQRARISASANGFARKSSAPIRSPVTFESRSDFTDSMMTGMNESSERAFTKRSTSRPSMSGRTMSRSTRSGGAARTCRIASLPSRAAGRAAIAALDLDSTLLDNRPRQAEILRDYGRFAGIPALGAVGPEHLQGWDLERALRNAGLSRGEVDLHAAAVRRFWEERFFTNGYCRLDVPVPGSAAFARAVRATGCRIAYVTGHPPAMEAGTLHVLRRFGFPLPDGVTVFLLMKPGEALRDDAWKAIARDA